MISRNNDKPLSLFKWIWKSYLRTALIPLVIFELTFLGMYFLANKWFEKEIMTFLKEQSQNQLLQIADQKASVIHFKIESLANSSTYSNDFLEGLLGIDATSNILASELVKMEIPWEGYALLVGTDGKILALPNKAKEDWRSNESLSDYFNQISLHTTINTDGLADRVLSTPSGYSPFIFHNSSRVVSWASMPDIGWKLLVIVPEENIYYKATAISNNTARIRSSMLAALVFFHCIFFLILYKTARQMSDKLSQPLQEINNMAYQIGKGDYYQKAPHFHVHELKETASSIVTMGMDLGTAYDKILTVQDKLKAETANLQALINSIDDTILEMNKDNKVVRMWSKDTHNLAKSYIENRLTSIENLLDQKTAEITSHKIKNVILTGEPDSLEYSLETDKGLRWFQARISCIGNSENVVVSARDITALKEMEHFIITAKEDAENANNAKSQFLSSMSHELRTPLNAILGFSQLLELDPESPLNESQSQCVREILKAGSHLLQLINEVLDLAKIEAGKITLSSEPIQIQPLIEETLSLIKPLADQYHIELIACPIENLNGFVSADRIRIKQVLINLLSNAVKYNKENGSILLYYQKIQNTIRFSVADTGYGISKNDLEEIFKPFYRLNTKNTAIEGTGIGLAVAKQLIELMDGKISVETQEGVGSHFSFELPYDDTEQLLSDSSLTESQNITCFSTHKMHKILYIEDNPASLKLVEHILNRTPNIVLLSSVSGELGIDLARVHKPDLILLDIHLPGIDGYEIFTTLKTYEQTSNIPIIAVSANAMPGAIQKSLSLGFTDYIVKPINVLEFLEKVFKALDEPDSVL